MSPFWWFLWTLHAALMHAPPAMGAVGTAGVRQESQPAPRITALALVQDDRIRDLSGIAASVRHPGLYYVHNDSGDEPRVFLIDREGRTRAVIRLDVPGVRDPEDIALAPGARPGTWDVCLADIGDNPLSRREVAILRFPEPDLPAAPEATVRVTPTVHRFRYEEGPADAEAFCVHPRTGTGYILTKRLDGRFALYRLPAPWPQEKPQVLPRVAVVALPDAAGLARVVTAADIGRDGRRVLVRCYLDGWEWTLPPEAGHEAFERVFHAAPARVTMPIEPQGEAACYDRDDNAILTAAEGPATTLYEVRPER